MKRKPDDAARRKTLVRLTAAAGSVAAAGADARGSAMAQPLERDQYPPGSKR